jgi:threonine/homoserine/homoserine lactone efflux protein
MDSSQILVFAAIYAVFVITPGPGVAAVVVRGLSQGTHAATPYIAGFVLGDLIWFTIAASGLSVIALTYEFLFDAIKYAGCAYLLYLAWKIWNAPVATGDLENSSVRVAALPSFISALTIALGNPKVIVFFLSIMPLVVSIPSLTFTVFVELAIAIIVVFAPLQFSVLLAAKHLKRLFKSERALRRVNRTTAGMMAVTATLIAARR